MTTTQEDTYANRVAIAGVICTGLGLYFESNAATVVGIVVMGLYAIRRWLLWRDEL